MSLSYNMLTHLMLLIAFPPKRKIINAIFVFFGAFVVVFGGARGAAISLLIGVFLICFFSKKGINRKICVSLITAVVFVVIIVFYNDLLGLINQFLKFFDIESRTFNILLQESTQDVTSGRDIIYEVLWTKVDFLGNGFFTDRALLNGRYAHNLILELLIDFGWIFGSVLCLLFVFLLLFALFKSPNFLLKVIIVFIPAGFIGLLLSGSYLNQFPVFYVLLALIMTQNKKIEKRDTKSNAGLNGRKKCH